MKLRKSGDWRSAIPGTNILTNVAAKNVVSHTYPKFFRNRPVQFDRQVGDALTRIHHVGLDECLRRARIETPGATPTQIRRGKLIRAESRFQFQRRENHTEEKVRAKGWMKQQ